MPGKNKTPLLGWHPPAGLSRWVRAEAKRRGITLTEDQIIARYKEAMARAKGTAA